jgi:hypothetical protein
MNCPQHIHHRFSQKQIAPVIQEVQERVQMIGLEPSEMQHYAIIADTFSRRVRSDLNVVSPLPRLRQ